MVVVELDATVDGEDQDQEIFKFEGEEAYQGLGPQIPISRVLRVLLT